MSSALLAKIITEEHASFLSFLALLDEEYEVLLRGQVEALTPLLVKLETVASNLSEFARQRETLIGQHNNVNPADMVNWIKANAGSDSSHLLGLWRALIDIAEKTRLKHLANGSLIETLARNNTHAIQVLAAASQINSLYGPDGKLQGFSSFQLRGQA
ncbi:MAG TPA: flagellar protein FlgN [Burkholderiales bacterium]|nr:flagellar protein FlgN [Burkholderiales bacterium]